MKGSFGNNISMENEETQSSSLIPEPGPVGFLGGSRKLYIAVAMLALALAYFGFTAFQGATVFYVTVEELKQGQEGRSETIRVSGKLVPDTFEREAQGTVAFFNIASGNETLPASYNGILPDLFFNEHSEIVLQGTYEPQGVFEAESVVVKCPSKYQPVEEPSEIA